MEFEKFPKLPRLNRDMVITEKIDGTNACIVIEDITDAVALKPIQENWDGDLSIEPAPCNIVENDHGRYALYAQSRKRIICPGKKNDNMGFATWVSQNSQALLHLGVGRHFGEWWGQSIQRTYGLEEKRFSLFNAGRASYRAAIDGGVLPPNVDTVPILEQHTFDQGRISTVLEALKTGGSQAAPGFPDPEGIVVFHVAARQMFKVTLENDESPKSVVA